MATRFSLNPLLTTLLFNQYLKVNTSNSVILTPLVKVNTSNTSNSYPSCKVSFSKETKALNYLENKLLKQVTG